MGQGQWAFHTRQADSLRPQCTALSAFCDVAWRLDLGNSGQTLQRVWLTPLLALLAVLGSTDGPARGRLTGVACCEIGVVYIYYQSRNAPIARAWIAGNQAGNKKGSHGPGELELIRRGPKGLSARPLDAAYLDCPGNRNKARGAGYCPSGIRMEPAKRANACARPMKIKGRGHLEAGGVISIRAGAL